MSLEKGQYNIVEIICAHCKSLELVKFGTSRRRHGTQRYRCKDCMKTFVGAYKKEGYKPEVKQKIIDMTLDGNGARATARLLGIDQNTVMSTLRKKAIRSQSFSFGQ